METPQITFLPLSSTDASALAALLQAQTSAYMAGFHPFVFDENELRRQLEAIRQDVWWGIETEGQLAGLVMLRGFNEGYERPAFGIFVGEEFSGRGLARQALRHCLAWCLDRGIPRVMLKVEPVNLRAKNLYLDEGFKVVGVCSTTGQDVMEWSAPS